MQKDKLKKVLQSLYHEYSFSWVGNELSKNKSFVKFSLVEFHGLAHTVSILCCSRSLGVLALSAKPCRSPCAVFFIRLRKSRRSWLNQGKWQGAFTTNWVTVAKIVAILLKYLTSGFVIICFQFSLVQLRRYLRLLCLGRCHFDISIYGLGYTVNSLKTGTTVRPPPLYKTHCHGWLVPSSRISHVCMQLNSFYASTIQQGGQLELFMVARVSTLERVRCAIVIGAERGGKGRASRTSRLNSISTSPSPHYTYHAD